MSASRPRQDWEDCGFDTRQVHAGEALEPAYGSRITPIHLTAAYRFDDFDQAHARFATSQEGQLYSRDLNPTNMVAERRISSLEGGTEAVLVSSGQAAITSAVLALATAGEHIVTSASIYSGTRIFFLRQLPNLGIETTQVWDPHDESEWERAITPQTRAIFTESIPNPRNDIVDIAFVASIAGRHGIPLIVDNTIATPYLLRPFEHGADIVVHSTTKFLGGHGQAVSGVVVDGGRFDWASGGKYPRLSEPPAPDAPSAVEQYGKRAFGMHVRHRSVNELGFAVSPLHGFLVQQGMETLSLRMAKHLDNTRQIVRWLSEQPEIASVDYAGLPGNPRHELALRLYGGRSGSVFSFTLHGGLEAARTVFDRLTLWSRMTNIGDTRSMVLHPATTTHGSFTPEDRERLGITPGMLRLSVGLEDPEDLIKDLRQAFDALPGS